MFERLSEFLTIGLCGMYNFNLIAGFIIVVACGYLLGSLNFAVIISRVFYKDDIRNHGSGNAGATNMLRTYGRKAAAFTFIGDALKTALAVLIGSIFMGHNIIYVGSYIGGLAAVIGHVFPCFYKFKGGKGVVATAILVLCTEPFAFIILIIIFIVIVYGTKFISLGSVMCVIIYPLLLYRIRGAGMYVIIAMIVMLLVVYLHRENIKRLLVGEESKVNFGKKKSEKEEKEK